jgi:hypothetical protein
VAATYDGATISLYLDGALVSSAAAPDFAGTGASNAYVGRDPIGGGFRGSIDEVRISDVALAPSAFLNAPPAAVPLPGVAAAGLSLIGGVGGWRLLGRPRRARRETDGHRQSTN